LCEAGELIIGSPATADPKAPRVLTWVLDQFGCLIRGQFVFANASVELPVANRLTCIVGPNGGGKSTLLKLFTGQLYKSGFRFQGTAAVDFGDDELGLVTIDDSTTPEDVASWGIQYVGQEPLLPEYTNPNDALLAGFAFNVFRRCDHAATRARLAHQAAQYGINIDLRERRFTYSRVELQKISVLAALAKITPAGLLILDEVTAGFSAVETRTFFTRLAQDVAGLAYSVIFVSHRPSEINFANAVFEVRHGRIFQSLRADVAAAPTIDVSANPANTDGKRVLEVSLRNGQAIRVTAGELVETSFGSSVDEDAFLRGLTGETDGLVERLRIRDIDVSATDYVSRRRLGLRIITADRMRLGLFGELTALENIAVNQRPSSGLALIPFVTVRQHAALFGFTDHELAAPVAALSGGYKQRVMFAREMDDDAAVVVAFNPFQGIDAATRPLLESRMRELLARGAAILIVSPPGLPSA
jgi:ABC-type uncharacterized transport system ATPase subunit